MKSDRRRRSVLGTDQLGGGGPSRATSQRRAGYATELPQIGSDLGHRVRVLPDPAARLGPSPLGQHTPRSDHHGPLGERDRRTRPVPAAPHPLRPTQQRPADPRRAGPAPDEVGGHATRPPPNTTGTPPGPRSSPPAPAAHRRTPRPREPGTRNPEPGTRATPTSPPPCPAQRPCPAPAPSLHQQRAALYPRSSPGASVSVLLVEHES